MKYLTNDIYRFSGRSRIALAIVSATVFAGFTWPFYVQTQSSAHFAQYFFWAAVPASIFLLIAQLSDSGLDAKSVALLGTLAALLAALRPLGAGAVGLFAGSFPARIKGRAEILLLVFIAILASLIFGLLMDLQFWPWALGGDTQLSYLPGAPIWENLNRFITFHFLSSMAWDIPRAVLTSTLIVITAPAVLSALRRTKTKAAFLTPVEFSARLK